MLSVNKSPRVYDQRPVLVLLLPPPSSLGLFSRKERRLGGPDRRSKLPGNARESPGALTSRRACDSFRMINSTVAVGLSWWQWHNSDERPDQLVPTCERTRSVRGSHDSNADPHTFFLNDRTAHFHPIAFPFPQRTDAHAFPTRPRMIFSAAEIHPGPCPKARRIQVAADRRARDLSSCCVV